MCSGLKRAAASSPRNISTMPYLFDGTRLKCPSCVRREIISRLWIAYSKSSKPPTNRLPQAIESGADDYVSKPLKSELRTRLRVACRILELQQFGDVSSHAAQSPVYRGGGLPETGCFTVPMPRGTIGPTGSQMRWFLTLVFRSVQSALCVTSAGGHRNREEGTVTGSYSLV